MIKKHSQLSIAVVVCLLFALPSQAQQDPHYTHYMYNQMLYNPAYAGSKDAICATILYHNQWTGFEGAPEFNTASINGSIGEHHGIGLSLLQDELGFEKSTSFSFSYAYKFSLNNTSTLAVGPSVGMVQKSLQGDKLIPLVPGDPSIPTSVVSDSKPDVGFGMYYTNNAFKNLYVGLSATHLLQSTLTYTWGAGNQVDVPLALHYYLVAGLEHQVNSLLTLKPSLLVKRDPAKTQLDVTGNVVYNNQFRGGIAYRSQDAISILLGYEGVKNMNFGYSYDVTTSQLNNHSNGTHEIFLTYCFKPKITKKVRPINIRLTPRFL